MQEPVECEIRVDANETEGKKRQKNSASKGRRRARKKKKNLASEANWAGQGNA